MRQHCDYIVKPAALIERDDLPDHIYRRYDKLLMQAWRETGAQYAYVTLSNTGLAELWHVTETTARDTIAEMRALGLVETWQIGQRERRIKIIVAHRSRKDSPPERTAAPGGHNAPDTREAHRVEAPATAAKTVAPTSDFEGATHSRTLSGSPNSTVVVGTQFRVPKNEQQQQISTTGAQKFSPAELERIGAALEAMGIHESADAELLALAWMDAEYLEAWAEHARQNPHLGGGWYRQQIRAGRSAPGFEPSPSPRNDEPIAYLFAERAGARVDTETTGTAEQVWRAALDELQYKMTKATFDAWLRGSVGIEMDEGAGVLTVQVREQRAKEWLEARLTTTIKGTIAGIVGRAMNVEYQVGGEG